MLKTILLTIFAIWIVPECDPDFGWITWFNNPQSRESVTVDIEPPISIIGLSRFKLQPVNHFSPRGMQHFTLQASFRITNNSEEDVAWLIVRSTEFSVEGLGLFRVVEGSPVYTVKLFQRPFTLYRRIVCGHQTVDLNPGEHYKFKAAIPSYCRWLEIQVYPDPKSTLKIEGPKHFITRLPKPPFCKIDHASYKFHSFLRDVKERRFYSLYCNIFNIEEELGVQTEF